ncbi:hypothetical protein FQN52_009505 [Onygenales sp. PD_12]|nr:hypothetical protein FQN52_009505 [Onygenales sp. PD_12]
MSPIMAPVDFLADLPIYETEKPYWLYPLAGSDDKIMTNVVMEPKHVEINDARKLAPQLEKNGFEIHRHKTRCSQFATVEDIERYKQETAELLRAVIPNVEHVVVYNATLRRNQPQTENLEIDVEDPLLVNAPATAVHIDATPKSGPEIVMRHLDDAIIQQYTKPGFAFSVINTWRTLVPALEDCPLALCDYQTIDFDDLIPADRVYPHLVGEIFYAKFNPGQRWYWTPRQETDEIYVFVNYRAGNRPSASFCPHVSFQNPNCPSNAPARQSIETRSVVVTRTS